MFKVMIFDEFLITTVYVEKINTLYHLLIDNLNDDFVKKIIIEREEEKENGKN